jgi:hypothetical protein
MFAQATKTTPALAIATAMVLTIATFGCSDDVNPAGSETPENPRHLDPEQPADRTFTGDQAFPDGFTVPADEIWELDPDATTTLSSEANVVVEGGLRMRPSSPDVVHTLRFDNIDERRFVGAEAEPAEHDDAEGHAGHEVVEGDVGLWVVGDGRLFVEGSERAGWNRTGADPNWQPEDEVRVAPTESGEASEFAEFVPGSPVPEVSYADETYSAEVLNLTRNARIEGAGDGDADPDANGRAHIWIGSTQPQVIRYAELRHLGPRQATDDHTEGVLGRYPLHFHMMGEGSQGSIVEGVVVADSGNRAFVPHASHGITFRDTIAYNVFDDAYWWDPDDTGHGGEAANMTNDLTYEHAMAALVRHDPDYRGYTLSGFALGEGANVSVTDSVAVGVQGNNTASGFHWPATANGNEHNVWDFRDNVAHNNKVSGIFVWQNDDNAHLVEAFVGYRNGAFGVDHGAYTNSYAYERLTLFENGTAGIRSKAASSDRPQTWRDIDTDGILIADRALDSDIPTVFDNITLRGEIVVDESADNGSGHTLYEFRDVRTADGSPLSADDFELRHQVSDILVSHTSGVDFEL